MSSVSIVSASRTGSTEPSTWVTSGVLEAAQHVDDRVGLANVAEELVAEPLAARGTADQARDVDEFEAGRHDLL